MKTIRLNFWGKEKVKPSSLLLAVLPKITGTLGEREGVDKGEGKREAVGVGERAGVVCLWVNIPPRINQNTSRVKETNKAKAPSKNLLSITGAGV